MEWAARRQFFYASMVTLAVLVVIVAGWFAFFFRVPSCTDGILNQDEAGIDCDGRCATMCVPAKVPVVWARSVEVAPGVYHAVALVRNPLTDAEGTGIPYAMRVFDSKNILIAEIPGTLDLHPGEVRPVFVGNVRTGERTPARTFVDLGAGFWQKSEPFEDPVRVISPELDQDALRLTATLENTTAVPVGRLTATALLYDAEGVLVAASQTVVDGMGPRATKQVVFTWQQPFTAPVVQTDIVPRILTAETP